VANMVSEVSKEH